MGTAEALQVVEHGGPAVRVGLHVVVLEEGGGVAAGLRATAAAVGAGLAGLVASDASGLLLALIGASWIASAVILAAYPRGAAALEGGSHVADEVS